MSSLSGARAIHFPSEADEPLSVVPGFHPQQKPVVGPAQFVAQCVTILECLIKESSHGTIPAERARHVRHAAFYASNSMPGLAGQ